MRTVWKAKTCGSTWFIGIYQSEHLNMWRRKNYQSSTMPVLLPMVVTTIQCMNLLLHLGGNFELLFTTNICAVWKAKTCGSTWFIGILIWTFEHAKKIKTLGLHYSRDATKHSIWSYEPSLASKTKLKLGGTAQFIGILIWTFEHVKKIKTLGLHYASVSARVLLHTLHCMNLLLHLGGKFGRNWIQNLYYWYTRRKYRSQVVRNDVRNLKQIQLIIFKKHSAHIEPSLASWRQVWA